MTDHDAPILFDCPRCHAVPGQRCTGTARAVQYSHQPRQDRYIRATRRARGCIPPPTPRAASQCPHLTRDTHCPLHTPPPKEGTP